MTTKHWKGAAMLAVDAVVHGSAAVERVQLATAKRTFDILESIPVIAPPSALVRVVHDGITKITHTSIRGVARVAAGALGYRVADPAER